MGKNGNQWENMGIVTNLSHLPNVNRTLKSLLFCQIYNLCLCIIKTQNIDLYILKKIVDKRIPIREEYK